MGVGKAGDKKKYQKKKYSTCYIYYKDEQVYLDSGNCSTEEAHFFDGSINHEDSLQHCYNHGPPGGGRLGWRVFYRIVSKISKFTDRCVEVHVVFDLDARPAMKDLDETRSYDPNARRFSVVSDTKFPLLKHPRNTELKKLQRELKKVLPNEFSGKLEKDSNREVRMSLQARVRAIEAEPVDVWSMGKGVRENRMMLYQYYAGKFKQHIRENNLPPGHRLYVDGMVEASAPDKYTCLTFRGGSGGSVPMNPSGCVEGEQAVMYKVQQVVSRDPTKKCVIHSTDTDFYTYAGLFLAALPLLGMPREKADGVELYTITKNWYQKNWSAKDRNIHNGTELCQAMEWCRATPTDRATAAGAFQEQSKKRKPLEEKARVIASLLAGHSRLWTKYKKVVEKKALEILKDDYARTCRVYTIDHSEMNRLIRAEYTKYTKWPVITYWVFWGIFWGNDFIRRVHENFQKPKRGKGLPIQKFMVYWFDKVLKRKNTLVKVRIKKDRGYYPERRVVVELDISAIISTFRRYYKKHVGLTFRLTAEKRKRLVTTCLNTQYIFGYIVNQYRRISVGRRTLWPDPHTLDEDGRPIYGYDKDKTGKTIQATEIPLKYEWLIL